MGSSSHHYLVFLLGVMASGNVVVPLDVQLNEETFADNVNRSDLDILFYDWDHYGLVEAVKEKCHAFGPAFPYSTENMCHVRTRS